MIGYIYKTIYFPFNGHAITSTYPVSASISEWYDHHLVRPNSFSRAVQAIIIYTLTRGLQQWRISRSGKCTRTFSKTTAPIDCSHRCLQRFNNKCIVSVSRNRINIFDFVFWVLSQCYRCIFHVRIRYPIVRIANGGRKKTYLHKRSCCFYRYKPLQRRLPAAKSRNHVTRDAVRVLTKRDSFGTTVQRHGDRESRCDGTRTRGPRRSWKLGDVRLLRDCAILVGTVTRPGYGFIVSRRSPAKAKK